MFGYLSSGWWWRLGSMLWVCRWIILTSRSCCPRRAHPRVFSQVGFMCNLLYMKSSLTGSSPVEQKPSSTLWKVTDESWSITELPVKVFEREKHGLAVKNPCSISAPAPSLASGLCTWLYKALSDARIRLFLETGFSSLYPESFVWTEAEEEMYGHCCHTELSLFTY